MRESIGATWILGIVLFFIALFSAYLAFSINYSKAFRVKNGLIERIEKYNGINDQSMTSIKTFIKEINYATTGTCSIVVAKTAGASPSDLNGLSFAGYEGDNFVMKSSSGRSLFCLQKMASKNASDQIRNATYKVYVFFSIRIPLVPSGIFKDTFFLTGETMSLPYPIDNVFV